MIDLDGESCYKSEAEPAVMYRVSEKIETMAQSRIIKELFEEETLELAKTRMRLPAGEIQLSEDEIESAWSAFRHSKDHIRKEMENMTWKPQKAKAVYVKRDNGADRKVMVLSCLDRLVQKGARSVPEDPEDRI